MAEQNKVEEFPDPMTFEFPEEVKMDDGTIIRGKTVGESGIITNRKTWKLYPTFDVVVFKPEDNEAAFKSLQDGKIYHMPKDPVTIFTALYVLDKPGSTPEDVAAAIVDWVGNYEPKILEDEDLLFRWGVHIMNILVMLWMYKLIRIEK